MRRPKVKGQPRLAFEKLKRERRKDLLALRKKILQTTIDI